MKNLKLLSTTVIAAVGLFSGDLDESPNSILPQPGVGKTVVIASLSGQSYEVTTDSLRVRFCSAEGAGPCYDYRHLFVHLDNCGVTAFPLSEITYFENRGEFSPTYCIHANQSAKLKTERMSDRHVYVSDRFWSLVGAEIDTGDDITLPFGNLKLFQQVSDASRWVRAHSLRVTTP